MCSKYLLSRRQHHALKQEWANSIKLVLNLERNDGTELIKKENLPNVNALVNAAISLKNKKSGIFKKLIP
jgi:hypothetical protein